MTGDLPNDCFITAVCAASMLDAVNKNAKILRICGQLPDGRRFWHAVTVFTWTDKVRIYDWAGTMTLPKNISIKSHPTSLAKAWLKARGKATDKCPFEKINYGEWV